MFLRNTPLTDSSGSLGVSSINLFLFLLFLTLVFLTEHLSNEDKTIYFLILFLRNLTLFFINLFPLPRCFVFFLCGRGHNTLFVSSGLSFVPSCCLFVLMRVFLTELISLSSCSSFGVPYGTHFSSLLVLLFLVTVTPHFSFFLFFLSSSSLTLFLPSFPAVHSNSL